MENIIAIITLFATIIVPSVIYLVSRNKKELSYEVSSSTLLAENQEFREKLRIIIDDKEIIGDIFVILLKIVNSGNTPIRIEDFTEDIDIFLEGELLQAELKKKKPYNLRVILDKNKTDSSLLRIKPLLLNKNDEFILKILSTKSEEEIKVNSRIVGIKEISKFKPRSLRYYHFLLMIMFGVALTISFYFFGQNEKLSAWFFIGISIGTLLVIFEDLYNFIKSKITIE